MNCVARGTGRMPNNNAQGAKPAVSATDGAGGREHGGHGFSHKTESDMHRALEDFRKLQRNEKTELLVAKETEIRDLLTKAHDEGGAGPEKQVKLVQACKLALVEAAKGGAAE